MRIALLSDIHGNSVALDAVLSDIKSAGGVEEFWVVGDHVAIGADPNGVMQRLNKLSNANFTRGNTDRYVTTGDRPDPSFEDVQRDPGLLSRLVQVSRSFAWTLGMVTAGGWFEWLANLPLEKEAVLPDGTRLLAVHASPGMDGGEGFHPNSTQIELKERFGSADFDLVCVGHTHAAVETTLDGMRIVNLGSISNPNPPDLRASYIICESDGNGYRLERRRVGYDLDKAIEAVRKVNPPAADFIIAHFRGEVIPGWST